MKLLFVGESWMGSSARAIKEGLRHALDSTRGQVDEINEDHFVPIAKARWMRAVNRVLAPAYRRKLAGAVIKKCREERPDGLLVYKGTSVDADLIRAVKALGIFTANVFPDYSPHAYGPRLREALGAYDLIISTKPFHPRLWRELYGYSNECVFVPHGYDPTVHYRAEPQAGFDFDVGLVATWRPEYHALMRDLGALLPSSDIRVAIAGNGWAPRANEFPSHWSFPGGIVGPAYADWSRRCKIMVAPVNTEVVIAGRRQPGDEDTTRTYELAAAHCFFVHRRTDYVSTLYDENEEVPLFDGAQDLAALIRHYFPLGARRSSMADAAHRRAVPAYSTDVRAITIADLMRERMRAE